MNLSFRQQYERLQVFIYALQLDEWPFKEINKNDAWAEVAKFAQKLGINPADKKFLPKFEIEISKLLAQPPETAAASIPANLAELVKIYEDHLIEAQETIKKWVFPTLDEEIERIYQKYQENFLNEIQKLIQNPRLTQTISHQIALKLAQQLPQTATEGLLEKVISLKKYQIMIKKIINQELKRVSNKILSENAAKNLTEKTLPEAKSLASTPRNRIRFQKIEKGILDEIPITSTQLAELPELKWQSSGIRINFFRKNLAFAKKVAFFPAIKSVQILMDLAPESFQKNNPEFFYALKIGLTPEAVEEKIGPLWEELRDRLPAFQKKHPIISFLSRHYFEYNRLGKSINLIKPKIGRSFLWQAFKKTKIGQWLGKAAAGILTKLGLSTIAGPVGAIIAFWPTIKKWGKKFLKWAGAALGALFLWAAHYGPAAIAGLTGGLAVGLPFAFKAAVGVGGAVTAALSFLGPIAPVIGFFSGLITFIVVDLSFGLVGLGVGIGGQLLWDKIAAAAANISIPQIIGGGINQITGAASSIVKPAVLGTVGATAGLTLIVSQVNSGAFVEKSQGEFIPNFGEPVPARSLDESKHLAENVIFVLNQCGITYVTQNNWSETENCLSKSKLTNKQIIINHFRDSTNSYFSLQCVGFVRGIMAALGKSLGEGRKAARNFLDPPTPEDFEPVNTNMNGVQIGDIVIKKGETDGHIGIVIDKFPTNIGIDYISVAQTWGYTDSGGKGVLQITKINPVAFDGFLKPK